MAFYRLSTPCSSETRRRFSGEPAEESGRLECWVKFADSAERRLGMLGNNGNRNRTWQEIAEEAGREKDPDRRRALTEELYQVLSERDQQLKSDQ
jgi:hypothetical protein